MFLEEIRERFDKIMNSYKLMQYKSYNTRDKTYVNEDYQKAYCMYYADKLKELEIKLNDYIKYKATNVLTIDSFDNIGISYKKYLTADVPLYKTVLAHIINFKRLGKDKDVDYFFSYETIAKDLKKDSDGAIDKGWQSIRGAIRQLLDLKVIYAVESSYKDKKDAVVNHGKKANQYHYRSLHIDYNRLKELTSIINEKKIKALPSKSIEKKFATKPFVVCKYEITDRHEFYNFVNKVHINIMNTENVNTYVKFKPKECHNKKERSLSVLGVI